MSWDDNCKTLLQSFPVLSNLVVVGLEGVLYGTSNRDTAQPSDSEVKEVIAVNKGGSATRFNALGRSCLIVNRIDNIIVGKHEKTGVIVGNTSKIVLIGEVDESQGSKSGAAVDAIFKLQDYFEKSGF